MSAATTFFVITKNFDVITRPPKRARRSGFAPFFWSLAQAWAKPRKKGALPAKGVEAVWLM